MSHLQRVDGINLKETLMTSAMAGKENLELAAGAGPEGM